MSSSADDQSSQGSSVEAETKLADDHHAKMNGVGGDDSAGSDTAGAAVEPTENGISGDKHHKSSSSSSHKREDGHHKSSSDKSHKSSSSSKHSSSSSSSKNKEGSSGSSSKHGSSSSSSKHRDGSTSKHSSSSSSSKSKEGSSSSSHKDGKSSSSSSSSKHKDGSSSSSSKHGSSSSSSKHRDGSSSGSSKHRDGKESSSSSSKDKHSSSSDKDKHRDKDKHKSSSSSSDKHKSSSSSGDKHKSSSSSGDKSKSSSSSSSDKHKSSSSSDKHRSSSSSKDKHKSSSSSDKHKSSGDTAEVKVEIKDEKPEIKEEKPEIKEEKMEIKKEEKREIKDEFEENHVKSEPRSPVKKGSPVKKEVETPVKMDTSVKSEEEEEESEDEDKPLSIRINESRPLKRPKEESDYEDEYAEEEDEDDEDEDIPLSARAQKAKKQKVEKKASPPPKAAKAKVKKEVKKEIKKEVKKEKPAAKRKAVEEQTSASPTKKKKEEEQEVWRWWEEEKEDSDVKWTYLEHKGPVFAPEYEPLPKNVRIYYEGKPLELTEATEEVATFYGRMLDHDYTTKEVFNKNFMKDWRAVMTKEEKEKITDLKKCNFTEVNDHFKKKSEERKAQSKEFKQNIKKENEAITAEYGFCVIDHHKEKIGNFKIEPPSLFRGRGDHPKQGMLKRRVLPEDVIINCSQDSEIPQAPKGHKWKEVRHDNKVTWLCSWTENIQGATKYVMLNAASKLKGQKDWQKYETARKLHQCVDKIRAKYQDDWKSKEMRVRQRAVALYFIDKLALRAGNEKDDESADTVGCCSLRVEHVALHETKDGKQNVVEFDFLGKDSIRYFNSIPVEKRVFKNLQLFVENKAPDDDLFDRLNTTILNKHLQDLMDGLTAKVFRTYNASKTLSDQLELLTDSNDQVPAKLLSYNRANRAVAILCNHQRAVPKTFEKSMENLQKKIDAKNDDIKQVKKDIKTIKSDYKQQKSLKTKQLYEKKKKTLARLEEQLTKLEVQATDRDENKDIALGTSKLNYLDPRISVAWCKKFDVPTEKVYNKTQRDKFRWAIDMATEQFKF